MPDCRLTYFFITIVLISISLNIGFLVSIKNIELKKIKKIIRESCRK